jgi:hypothetical protein
LQPQNKTVIMKKKLYALAGGLVGTAVLTALHQSIRYTLPDIAPRMDLLDLSLIHKVGDHMHLALPPDNELYKATFIGEIICNTAYYSLIGGDCPQIKGWLLGAVAGASAVILPEHLGIDPAPSNRTKTTQYLTVGYYVAGALAAAATIRWLNSLSD